MIFFQRLPSQPSENEYSYLYSDVNEPENYKIISADESEEARHAEGDDDSEPYLNEHLQEARALNSQKPPQDIMLSKDKITVEIQLERTAAKNVATTEVSDDHLYLHAVTADWILVIGIDMNMSNVVTMGNHYHYWSECTFVYNVNTCSSEHVYRTLWWIYTFQIMIKK